MSCSSPRPRYECGVVWFRNDLRITDHAPLTEALSVCSRVHCVYFLPARYNASGYAGIPRITPLRAKFLVEALQGLQRALRTYGVQLEIVEEGVQDSFDKVFRLQKVDSLFYYDEAGTEEANDTREVLHAARRQSVAVFSFCGQSLCHPDDLPWDIHDMPDVFTKFRKQVERNMAVREPLPAPPIPVNMRCETRAVPEVVLPEWLVQCAANAVECDSTAFPFRGTEADAVLRINTYLWDTGNIEGYKETRNGLVGTEYSSKLSPWLAIGALSARSVYSEVKRYEQTRVRNESTYWLVFELLWRDFFLFQMMKHGRRSFRLDGPFSKKRSWSFDPDAFEAWKQGRTGVPFVDAGMRELVETGYMSNRIRQNCASFLSNNLNIDWRYGAQWFEAHLLDYDVSSNWGNWAYNSRVGCDPRDRFFDVVGQGERYDRNAEFISLWIPELAHLSSRHRHRPWLSPDDTGRYPRPVIDLEASYERLRRESRKS